VQSGLKVFRAEILSHIDLKTTAWGFDYQFLYRARRMGYRIGQVDIVFEERMHGISHVRALNTMLELGLGALLLRMSFLTGDLLPFLAYPHRSEYQNPGFANTRDFLFLPAIASIKQHIFAETVVLAIVTLGAAAAVIGGLSFLTGFSPLLLLSALIAALYVGIIGFKVRVVREAVKRKPLKFSRRELAQLKDEDLPSYTVIIPLYQEAEVIPQIAKAMTMIDYPTDKLDIVITLEEYDQETIEAIERAALPSHFRTIILPDVKPKTKPKALNVAFLQTHGELLVIFDAEIIPDADQLKKAVLAFRKFPDIACIQTRLDHYNADQNWITKLFNAEFSFHYDMFLPGLQKLGYALPLSGHSTHFRRAVLEDIGAWDPYNLTEDCDVGIRLFRNGYKTDIIDSYSREEATSSLGAWIIQRSRWMKGFIQTSIVHLRHPVRLKNELGGWGKFCAFLLIVPGSVLMNIINLFYWGLFGAWLVTHSAVIQSLFPGPVLYLSLFSFAAGNFLFMYLNLLGSYGRQRYSMVKYSLLSFFYWLMLAYSAVRACVHLVWKPHQWEKTKHGTHLSSPPLYAAAPLSS
jgi:cellulose synthase/poly-beta-1,6-N-acetylglucosamine synthase-like glycosyltransferase